jgi:chemotaxis protein MotB
MSSRKKTLEGQHENLERWLITYADMITLLMAFFLMMYAMSIVNKGKFTALALSVRTGFGGTVSGGLPAFSELQESPLSKPETLQTSDFRLLTLVAQIIKQDIMKGSRPEGLSPEARDAQEAVAKLMSQIDLVARGEDLIVRVAAGPLTFPRGSAELTPAAKRILKAVAALLVLVPRNVRIEGHTCNLPINTALYPSNWELSAQRAMNVLVYLIKTGIPPAQLSAVGYADTVPLVPNVDEAHRSRNRRVDIVLIGALSPEGKQALAKKVTGQIDESSSHLNPENPPIQLPDLTPQIKPTLQPPMEAEQ